MCFIYFSLLEVGCYYLLTDFHIKSMQVLLLNLLKNEFYRAEKRNNFFLFTIS